MCFHASAEPQTDDMMRRKLVEITSGYDVTIGQVVGGVGPARHVIL
ncbi:MAG TPA: hypothetical protein VIJ25_11510 [Methylococcales bacterium]